MKCEINEEVKVEEKQYPYLGKWVSSQSTSWQIVLFTAPKTGVLVASDDDKDLGYYCDDWSENLFPLYSGSVTLRN